MRVSVTLPLTFERMIEVFWGKWCGFNQEQKQCTQFAQVLAAFLCGLYITLELAGTNRIAHIKCPDP